EITSLKLRVKKLKKKGRSRTHKLKRLYKVGLSARVVTSDEEGLGKEDASKHRRKIHDIDADKDITLDSTHFDIDPYMFGVHDLVGDEVVVECEVAAKNKNDEVVVEHMDASAGEKVFLAEQSEKVVEEVVSTAKVSAATITEDEMTLAQALAELKSAAKVTTATTTTTKGKLKEALKMKKKNQVLFDEQEVIRLQAQFDEEERIKLAQRLQAEEQEELTIEEKSKLFQQLLEKRKKHFAAKRAEEKRNKPPTKAQQMSIMCTYLKNMAGWKPKDLKNKSFANIQDLFNKAMKRVNTFVDMDTELVGGSEVRAEGCKTREESSSKKAGDKLEHEKAKKQKVDDDKEKEDLKQCFEIIHRKGKQGYYEIMRADGSSKIYLLFSQLIKSFDREDLETLWKLVKAKHGNTRLKEGYERVLWGDLKTMFEHHIEDAAWRNLQGKKVLL
ncbi:hypothetical protein Tco_1477709, partial [Tanacetum coccineum]